jgi:hypothetical protein
MWTEGTVNFISVVPFVTGILLVTMAFLMDTKKFISTLVFKVVPMILGISYLFIGAKLLGMI